MKCEVCNTKIRLKFVQTTVEVEGKKVRFENIPAWVCACNESQKLSEETLAKARYFASITANRCLDFEQCEEIFGQAVYLDAVTN